jgi:FkbM family methyltransferase
MDLNNRIIEIKGSIWKHRLLNWLARHKEFPARLRLFNLLKKALRLDLLLCSTPSGIHLLADISDWVQYQIYFYGNYEAQSVALFRELSTQASVIFDVGAHIGQYALECANVSSGHDKKIFALEVNPKTFTFLLNNIQLNQFSDMIPVMGAVASQQGIMNIHIPAYWNMGNTQIDAEKKEVGFDNYLASAYRLPDLLEMYKIEHIDLMKMDLEGHELGILSDLFSAGVYPNHLILEYIPDVFVQCADMITLLETNNYLITDVNGNPFDNGQSLPEQNLWARKR